MANFDPIVHGFPYTDYHSMNLDFLMDLACSSFGLHLVVDGQYLKLVNKCGQEISKVTIAYSETALKDTDGHNINAYILSAGADSHNLLLTHGDGNVTTITIPYAVKAEKDMNDRDITSYVRSISTANDKIVVTFGDSTTFEITVPYAVKARDDKNGKDITSYVATVEPVADKLIVKDGNGTTLSEITVPYAEKALKDGDGDIISATYGATLSTGVSTVILRNKNGVQISEITVPYAERALKDVDGNVIKSTYGATLAVNGSKIGLNARDGSNLNEITVPFATLANDANNAIQTVSISGNTVTFTTYDGQVTSITVPYAVKALKDSLNNTIATSYVANVTTDPITGKFSFFAGDGSLIAEMIPTVDKAVHDSFNNTIADYIKTIVTDPNSNYVTVTHGDGDVDSITIEYSTTAWKDTYDNIIGNVYIKNLTFETVNNRDYLVAYNGEDSELFRLEIIASRARNDINGNPITNNYPVIVSIRNTNQVDYTNFAYTCEYVDGVDMIDGSSVSASDLFSLFNAGRHIYVKFQDTGFSIASYGELVPLLLGSTIRTLTFQSFARPANSTTIYHYNIDLLDTGVFTVNYANIIEPAGATVYLVTYHQPSVPAFASCKGLAGGYDPTLVSIKNLTTGETLVSLDLSVATKNGIVLFTFDNQQWSGVIPYSATNDFHVVCDYGTIFYHGWIESTDPADIETYWYWSVMARPVGYIDSVITLDSSGNITNTDGTTQTEYYFNYFATGTFPRVSFSSEIFLAHTFHIEDSSFNKILMSLEDFLTTNDTNTTDTFYLVYSYELSGGHTFEVKIPFKNRNGYAFPEVERQYPNWITSFT